MKLLYIRAPVVGCALPVIYMLAVSIPSIVHEEPSDEVDTSGEEGREQRRRIVRLLLEEEGLLVHGGDSYNNTCRKAITDSVEFPQHDSNSFYAQEQLHDKN